MIKFQKKDKKMLRDLKKSLQMKNKNQREIFYRLKQRLKQDW